MPAICTVTPDRMLVIFRTPIDGHYRWGSTYTDYKSGEEPAEGHPTLEELKKVPGIIGLHIPSKNEIWITKANLFMWEELKPQIIGILDRHDSFMEQI